MGLVLKHVIRTKAGTWHYRRRLPRDISGTAGRKEFKRLLGISEREALRNFPKVHAEFERMVSNARGRAAGKSVGTVRTPLDDWREAKARLAEIEAGLALSGSDGGPEDIDYRGLTADALIAGYPEDPETGEPVGVPEVERQVVNAVRSGRPPAPPPPTIEDARRLYLKERVEGDINEAAKSARLDRVVEYLAGASVTTDRTLASLTRDDARNVRDHLLRDRGIKPSTVRRYLNDIRAVIALGMREFSVTGPSGNPFVNLQIRGGDTAAKAAKDERKPVPPEMLPRIRERLEAHASADLWRIWRMVEGTGCRLGEVTGLAVTDVQLDAAIPHIDLVPHTYRRLKNSASLRRVPLVGGALTAAREAVEAASDEGPLFPRYGRVRGSDAASQILMKHVRAVTDDPKIVVHSLRHSMEDRMTVAGVSEFDRNLVLGHSSGGMSDTYGGRDARLEVAQRAIKAALGEK